MANKINKKTAYQLGFDGVIIPRETLEIYGLTCSKAALFNMSDKDREQLIDAVYAGDDADGCNRYCFYHETADGRVVNVYDGSTDGLNGEWFATHEDSGEEFAKFYKLVRV